MRNTSYHEVCGMSRILLVCNTGSKYGYFLRICPLTRYPAVIKYTQKLMEEAYYAG